jgi:hypothetical protein
MKAGRQEDARRAAENPNKPIPEPKGVELQAQGATWSCNISLRLPGSEKARKHTLAGFHSEADAARARDLALFAVKGGPNAYEKLNCPGMATAYLRAVEKQWSKGSAGRVSWREFCHAIHDESSVMYAVQRGMMEATR